MANVHVTTRGRGTADAGAFSIEDVTPKVAHEWLGLNTHNRKKSNATIARYARDMKAGEWEYTGDPIRFNGKGALIDGQHRLYACIEADTPFRTVVIRNLPLSVQEKLDQGKVRNAADHLGLRGLDHAISLAAAARQLIGIKRGFVAQRASGSRPTNAEVLATVDKHPGLADSIGALAKHVIGVSPSLLAAMHYIGAELLKDRETADAFVSVFATGEPTYRGDPAHLWRERLIAQTTQKTFLRTVSRVSGTVHAWNTFRRKEPLQIFRIPDELQAIEGLDLDLI